MHISSGGKTSGQIYADSITFTKFLTAVAARTGERLNYANIASDIGVSEPMH